MKTKVSEAVGPTLDWLVAKAGKAPVSDSDLVKLVKTMDCYKASTDWNIGGPIIEREKISIRQWTNVPIVHAYMPVDDAEWSSDGESPLIAAMRCFVASKLGDEVEVPDELGEQS